ncbi:hypothetical protein BDP55DRAFT_634642 [Colletotrichum godetiae]|uniref:Secreted protein n=1 Tax=Colletotrichum godetiae TaxID=1209918 RepID=A0AAJ0AEX8_9PEZI|nr:uncharacterized protein BDP55DRAFT_634642 [Colletotrichum godetiae]KAK1672615.1 hypothetical protein BDP55DRAFT_634642 [Colletotrichum godetiae]
MPALEHVGYWSFWTQGLLWAGLLADSSALDRGTLATDRPLRLRRTTSPTRVPTPMAFEYSASDSLVANSGAELPLDPWPRRGGKNRVQNGRVQNSAVGKSQEYLSTAILSPNRHPSKCKLKIAIFDTLETLVTNGHGIP